MTPLKSNPAGPLNGRAAVPGDKSISHRALIMGASATGETRIQGLLEGHDVLCTAAALRALGVPVDDLGGGAWRVLGRGVGGLTEPASVLDLGNSGTGVRLLMGLVASHGFGCVFAGDASLSSRPMERVMEPLRRMGAAFHRTWPRDHGQRQIVANIQFANANRMGSGHYMVLQTSRD